jgi:hypothetical protein
LAEPVLHKKGTRMYLNSRHKRLTAVLVVLFLIFSNAGQARAHGGGHGGGGGGGGHGGGGGFAGGGHLNAGYSGGGYGSSWSRIGVGRYEPGATSNPLVVDSPGFPLDLPEARIHRFLQQHLPHPHWVHWMHG